MLEVAYKIKAFQKLKKCPDSFLEEKRETELKTQEIRVKTEIKK